MIWVILFVLLPVVIIVGGILSFNVYMRKKIIRSSNPKPAIDQAYMKAEQTHGDDEDFGSIFGRRPKSGG